MTSNDVGDCTAIVSLAQCANGITSVGLSAVEFVYKVEIVVEDRAPPGSGNVGTEVLGECEIGVFGWLMRALAGAALSSSQYKKANTMTSSTQTTPAARRRRSAEPVMPPPRINSSSRWPVANAVPAARKQISEPERPNLTRPLIDPAWIRDCDGDQQHAFDSG